MAGTRSGKPFTLFAMVLKITLGPGGRRRSQIMLSFGQIDFDYTMYKPDGFKEESFKWDVARARRCSGHQRKDSSLAKRNAPRSCPKPGPNCRR
jgi:hypothetical protein